MKINTLVSLTALTTALVACGGGDINIDAQNQSSTTSTVDNSVGDGATVITGDTGSSDFECASYTDANDEVQTGQKEGDNCVYDTQFVNFDKPLLSDVTLTDIGDGAHIFTGSVYVGQNYETEADANAAGIFEGGDGATLTVRAGATVALSDPDSAIAITRGSRLVARGRADAPITFTSEADIRGDITSPEAVQTWGGLAIAGFGFLNLCNYEPGWDFADDSPLTLQAGQSCSGELEGLEGGKELNYGGTVPNDDSGELSYVVVKHAGFEVATDNELNGITFGAVGTGTELNNIEVYSNKDDGIEFFGGGADVTNYVAMYVQDDSIDLDQGYYGTITNALVIQGGGLPAGATRTGAHCVESDGSDGSNKAANIANDYVTQATINNLTCITSAKAPGVAGNGDPGAGINVEEGHMLTLNRSIVTTAYADATVDANGDALATVDGDGNPIDRSFQNYCFQLEDTEDRENAGNGFININTTIFACNIISSNKARDADITLVAGTTHGAISGQAFLEAQDNVVYQAAADGSETPDGSSSLNILNGYYSVPLAEMVVNSAAISFDDTSVSAVGAVQASSDWTAGWVYGLVDGNRGQALWFE
ncbi:MAG: serine/threonine protein kinase [Agarilytica sp.]